LEARALVAYPVVKRAAEMRSQGKGGEGMRSEGKGSMGKGSEAKRRENKGTLA
jgi:hypothetical protein